jgi:hypothetical protein
MYRSKYTKPNRILNSHGGDYEELFSGMDFYRTIIFPAVLYGCGLLSPTLREEGV